MKKIVMSLIALVAIGVSQASAQNLLSNPGFESTLTDPPTAVGDWFPFGSGAGGVATQVSTMPRSGQRHMDLTMIGANQFAGVFQDVPGAVNPGQTVIFSGWHKAVGADLSTHEIKIEWVGAPQSRVDVFNIGNDYSEFTHSAVAPAGVTGARVTYAISSFGAGQGDSTIFVDDLSARVIPEPATFGALGLGLLGLMIVRRRK